MDNNVSGNECGKQTVSKITSGICWSVPQSAAAQTTKWISSQDFDQDHLESLTVSKKCEQCVKQNTCRLHRKTDSVLCVLGRLHRALPRARGPCPREYEQSHFCVALPCYSAPRQN